MMSFALLASCSVKTNEEKARELIEPEVKANLIKPESYEFGKLQLYSCDLFTSLNGILKYTFKAIISCSRVHRSLLALLYLDNYFSSSSLSGSR